MELLSRWRRMKIRRDILSVLSDGRDRTFRDLTRATPRCPILVAREVRYLTALGFLVLRKDTPCTTARKTKLTYKINPNLAHAVARAIPTGRPRSRSSRG